MAQVCPGVESWPHFPFLALLEGGRRQQDSATCPSLSQEVAGAATGVTETHISCFLGHYQAGLNLAWEPEEGGFVFFFYFAAPVPISGASGLCPAEIPVSFSSHEAEPGLGSSWLRNWRWNCREEQQDMELLCG